MANTCCIDIVILGERKDLDFLNDKFNPDISETGFLKAIGVKENLDDYELRGYIDCCEYDEDQDALKLYICHAWSPCYDFMDLIRSRFDVTIYYYAEEFGCGVVETNDFEGEWFPQRYVIDSDLLDECIYIDDNKELSKVLKKEFNIDIPEKDLNLKGKLDEVEEKLTTFAEEEGGFINLYKVKLQV